MKKYTLVFKLAILDALEYRVDLLIHIFKYALFTALTALIWISVGKYSTFSPLSPQELVLYYAIAAVTYSFTNYHLQYVEEDIRTGYISKFLLKPISPFWYYFVFQFGISVLEAIFRGLVLLVILFFFMPSFTVAPINLLSFAALLLLSYLFSFICYFCLSILAFWFQYVDSIRMSFMFTLRLGSGLLVPIAFFPNDVVKILRLTPFPYVAHGAIQVIQGKESVIPAFSVLSIWTLVASVILFIVWRTSKKAYEGIGI